MTDTLMVGVSGVRGIVGKDLTPEVVSRWARAFGTWVRENGKRGTGNGKGSAVVVGRDARESGPAFAAAVTTGLTLVGCDVIDVGLVPTPTVQLAVEHHHAGGGIAITASHNPIEWNALKFVGSDGIFLDGNEGAGGARLAAGQAGNGKRETGNVSWPATSPPVSWSKMQPGSAAQKSCGRPWAKCMSRAPSCGLRLSSVVRGMAGSCILPCTRGATRRWPQRCCSRYSPGTAGG